MRARPKVTVVTPTFNRAPLLPETIDSIVGQTYEDYEYLIIDDGSTDETESVVRSYGDRVSYVRHENRGEAASTNRGWQMARGTYFAMVSSDDPMEPDWLEEAVRFLERRPSVIVGYPDWQIIDEHSRTIEEIQTFEYSFSRMVSWFYTIPGPGSLIRRSAVEDIRNIRNPRYRTISDLECWLRLGIRGQFARIPIRLASWRRHPSSITVEDRTRVRSQEFVHLAEEFFSRPDIPTDIRPLRRYAMSRAYWVAAWVLTESDPLRSALLLRRSWSLAPDNPPEMPTSLSRFPEPTLGTVSRLAVKSLGDRIRNVGLQSVRVGHRGS